MGNRSFLSWRAPQGDGIVNQTHYTVLARGCQCLGRSRGAGAAKKIPTFFPKGLDKWEIYVIVLSVQYNSTEVQSGNHTQQYRIRRDGYALAIPQ